MNKLITPILILALALFSCEKEIKLQQEDIDPRIVVNCIYNANDSCFLSLSESGPVVGSKDLPNLTNASAQLLDLSGNVVANFTHIADGRYYIANPFPQAGNFYQLKVSSDGLKPVSSSSATPNVLSNVQIDTSTSSGDINFNVSFIDNANEKNYYSISIVRHSVYMDPIDSTIYEYAAPYFNTRELYIINGEKDIDGVTFSDEFFFTDESFNGKELNFEGFGDYNPSDSSNYTVTVKNLSEDLFNYKLSFSNYMEASFDPFSEPVQVYSNIEDGFGIFGGYSSFVDSVITF